MTSYIPITNAEIDPESPITTGLMTKMRDNPISLVESLQEVRNLSLSFSVASNALTCSVKTDGGATASSTDTIGVPMRSSTASLAINTPRTITSALTLTISSGSTLGHVSARNCMIYWYLIDNAGTLELAASTRFFGVQGIVTTTAEGGAGAADSSIVMYSSTARTGVAFRLIAYSIDTQTTAGTWTATPSVAQLFPFTQPESSAKVSCSGQNCSNGVETTITWTSIDYDRNNEFTSTAFYPASPGFFLIKADFGFGGVTTGTYKFRDSGTIYTSSDDRLSFVVYINPAGGFYMTAKQSSGGSLTFSGSLTVHRLGN